MIPLQQRAAKGIAWAAFGSWGSQVSSLLVFLVLTRLLEPRDFGLVAMATVFTSFVAVFAEQGLGQAIVQRQALDPEHLDMAFWISLFMGISLTAIGFLVSPIVAMMYGEPDLQPIVAFLSISFLITALSSTQIAIFQRRLHFRVLSIRQLAASVLGGICGIAAAVLGAGAYALVYRTLVSGVVSMLLLWVASDWRPTFRYSWRHGRDLWGFGLNMVGVRVTNFARTHLDDLLIGMFLGPEALGLYTVAYRLARFLLDSFNRVVGSVALSAFSRLQSDTSQVRSAFYATVRFSSLIMFPLFSFLIILAPELIIGLSGEQWIPSIPAMRMLSIAGYAMMLHFICSYLLVAMGRPSWLLRIDLLGAMITAVAFFAVARFGIFFVAVAYTAVNIPFLAVYLFSTNLLIHFSMKRYLYEISAPFLSSVLMVVCIYSVKRLIGLAEISAQPLLWLIVLVLVGAVTYVGSVIVLRPDIRRESLQLVRAATISGT